MAAPFARRRDGGVDVTLAEHEATLVRSIVDQMDQVLEEPEGNPHTIRLFPLAYRDDADAQADFARLMTGELLDGKRNAIRSVTGTLDRGGIKRGSWRVRLTPDEAQDWLAVLNDARLTLGTRLDVTEQTYDREIDPDDPNAMGHEIFRYLGYLEEWLVDALMG
jgi:hypothetical protein